MGPLSAEIKRVLNGFGSHSAPEIIQIVCLAPFSSLLLPNQILALFFSSLCVSWRSKSNQKQRGKKIDLLPSPPLICPPSPFVATDGRLQPSSPPLFADQLLRQPPEATTAFFLSSLTANDPTSQRRRLILLPRNPRTTPLLSDFWCPSPPPATSISSLLPEPPSTQPPLFSFFLKTCTQPSSSLISGASTSTSHHLDLHHSLPPPL